MNKITYKKGDEIIIVDPSEATINCGLKVGSIGIVLKDITINTHNSIYNGENIPVELKNYNTGHDCGGLCEYGKGRKFSYYEIELLSSFKAVDKFRKSFIKTCNKENEKNVEKKIKKIIKKNIGNSPFNICSEKLTNFIMENKSIGKILNKNHMNNKRFVEDVNEFFMKFGIKNIVSGKEISVRQYQDKMTLWVFPEGKEFKDFDSDVDMSKRMELENDGFNITSRSGFMNRNDIDPDLKLKGYRIEDIYTININKRFLYLPEKNIIIMLVNPFINPGDISWRIETGSIELADSKKIDFKFRTRKEAKYLVIEKTWNKGIEDQIKSNKYRMSEIKDDMCDYEIRYKAKLSELESVNIKLREYEEMLKNNTIVKKMLSDMKDIRKLPFIKKVVVGESIRLDFGKIYIPYELCTGKKKNEEGMLVPKMEKVKVYIGDIYMRIYFDKVRVFSKEEDKKIINRVHPHVGGSNNPCFGDIQLTIAKLLKNSEFYEVTKLLYSWVTSYNKKSAYDEIEYFYENTKKIKRR